MSRDPLGLGALVRKAIEMEQEFRRSLEKDRDRFITLAESDQTQWEERMNQSFRRIDQGLKELSSF